MWPGPVIHLRTQEATRSQRTETPPPTGIPTPRPAAALSHGDRATRNPVSRRLRGTNTTGETRTRAECTAPVWPGTARGKGVFAPPATARRGSAEGIARSRSAPGGGCVAGSVARGAAVDHVDKATAAGEARRGCERHRCGLRDSVELTNQQVKR